MSENELAKAIECHIEMLMDEGELVRIGADKQPPRDLSQRIMRILAAYSALQKEIAKLKKQIQLMHDNGLGESWVEKFTAKTYELQAENAKLKVDLEYYGNHDSDCDTRFVRDRKCTCGYEKALKDNGCRAATETCGMTREELDGRI